MNDATLLARQKKDLLELAQDHGFTTSELEFTTQKSQRSSSSISVLRHRNNDFYVAFDTAVNSDFHISLTPGSATRNEQEFMDGWHNILRYVDVWFDNLRGEIDAEAWFASLEIDESNPRFNTDEQTAIISELDKLEVFLLDKYSGDAVRLKQIADDIEYLKTSSNRLGKKDFLLILVGILTQYGVPIANTITTYVSHIKLPGL